MTTPYEDRKNAVTLTNHQWIALDCYILMTTNHRKEEREAWQRLAEEKDENEQPRFKNAASNAQFYEEIESTLAEIRAAIDSRQK